MLEPVAYGLTVTLGLFIIVIGLRFLLAPAAAAAGYGVAAGTDNSAYLSAKGTRDITYGAIGLTLAAFAPIHAVAWFMLIVAVVPISDAIIVLRNGGTMAVALGIHGATAIAVLGSATLLFAA